MVRTIDECFFQIQNGANIKQGDVAGGFPITRIETTANDKFNRDRMGYAGITDISKYEAYVLEDGDLLMSHINSVQYLGRTVLYVKQPDETIIHGMNLLRLKAKRDIINPAYARYCFYGHPFRSQISNITKKSVNQASFAVKDLKQIKIDIPSVPEQKEVVEVLDKIQQLIGLRTDELLKLDNLIKARFVEQFMGKNYPLIPLEDLSLGKGEYGAQSASVEYDPNRPRYVRITDINDDGTLNDDVVSSANIDDDEQFKLSYGDFMFARMGATVGKTYAYRNGNQIFAGYLIRYKLNLAKIIPEYLYAYTKLEEYKNWVLLNQSGAAQPGINAKKYGSLRIPVATLEEQKNFADFIKQTDELKVTVEKALNEAQILFDSLMQKYFG
ncbi:MAG: restriction endonuclease subunit S [Lachnospiraceae bacterium]|nr:restriction endonuclease subunit S [Lachnospiraceae bacterium]